jgi:hypothetical protein
MIEIPLDGFLIAFEHLDDLAFSWKSRTARQKRFRIFAEFASCLMSGNSSTSPDIFGQQHSHTYSQVAQIPGQPVYGKRLSSPEPGLFQSPHQKI